MSGEEGARVGQLCGERTGEDLSRCEGKSAMDICAKDNIRSRAEATHLFLSHRVVHQNDMLQLGEVRERVEVRQFGQAVIGEDEGGQDR